MLRLGGLLLSLAFVVGAAAASASTRPAAYAWSKPKTLAPAGRGYDPAVAVAPNGTIVVAYELYVPSKAAYVLKAAVRSPSGKFRFLTLGPSYSAYAQPSVAVGGDGTFAVAWEHPGVSKALLNAVAVSIWRAGHRKFAPATIVSSDYVSTNHGGGDFPEVAVDDRGNVTAIWEEYYTDGAGTFFNVFESHRNTGALKWSKRVRLAPNDVNANAARLAVDGKGHEAVIWEQRGSGGGPAAIEASTRSPGQSHFKPEHQLAASTTENSFPSVGVSDKGKATFVWDQYESASDYRVEGQLAMGSAYATDAEFLSGNSPTKAGWHAAAMASSGAAMATWVSDVSGDPGNWTIQSSALPASSGHWGAPKTLGQVDSPSLAAPTVAIDDKLALFAWVGGTTGAYSLMARVKPSTGAGATHKFKGVLPTAKPVAAVANDSLAKSSVLGALVWNNNGIQLSVLRH